MTETESLDLADRHARRHARDKGAPPHWVRCDTVREVSGELYRCLHGANHTGAHRFVDIAEHDGAGRK